MDIEIEKDDFVVKKALIFQQSDYSLTRMIEECKGCQNLKDVESAKDEAEMATYIAHGFGIVD